MQDHHLESRYYFIMKLVSLIILALCLAACGKPDPKLLFRQGEYEQSLPLLLPLAEQGDQEAQNYLGVQYYVGLGVQRDFKEASNWFRAAATAGLPDAQKNYGDLFLHGYGVPQDIYQAFLWYFAASQQGHATAQLALANITDQNNLSPNQQMYAKLQANRYIPDPDKRFQSHDTYIEK